MVFANPLSQSDHVADFKLSCRCHDEVKTKDNISPFMVYFRERQKAISNFLGKCLQHEPPLFIVQILLTIPDVVWRNNYTTKIDIVYEYCKSFQALFFKELARDPLSNEFDFYLLDRLHTFQNIHRCNLTLTPTNAACSAAAPIFSMDAVAAKRNAADGLGRGGSFRQVLGRGEADQTIDEASATRRCALQCRPAAQEKAHLWVEISKKPIYRRNCDIKAQNLDI